MFEFEAEKKRRIVDLAPATKALFSDPEAEIESISLIPWEEHCTECAMPACYSTCDLYSARIDGKCRRFVNDVGFVPEVPTPQGYAIRVEFKRWAQLMAYASPQLVALSRAQTLEKWSRATDRVVTQISGAPGDFDSPRNLPRRVARRLKRWVGNGGAVGTVDQNPDYFLVEVFNPAQEPIRLSLSIRNSEGARSAFPYQELIVVEPGFSRTKIAFTKIQETLDLQVGLEILLSPNVLEKEDEGLTLFFGTLGFVRDRKYSAARLGPVGRPDVSSIEQFAEASGKSVKIVIWDLDNTVWDGVLVEDGPENIRLRPNIREIMRALDARGIVNSVVSKNDHDYAWEQLERFGLSEFIVFPRISWDPKGAAVAQVIADFNVGADTVVFVDDQPFEREQVRTIVPDIRTLNGLDYAGILELEAMNPEVSSESAGRRKFYLEQKVRRSAESSHGGAYEQFLRGCEIRLKINSRGLDKADRVHELVQRTNQMNFSGNRYTRDEIETILSDPNFDGYVISASDRFGEYGIIGFGLVERDRPCLIDLMFSCRIQSKRVEHAFLNWLLMHYRDQGASKLSAVYRKSDRNAPSGRVFDDLGFKETGVEEGVTHYDYDLASEILDDQIISITLES